MKKKRTLLSDKSLVQSYINGEEKALEILILRHKNQIYNLIRSKVKNTSVADDLLQETFVKVIKSLKRKGNTYTELGKLLPWCLVISNNIVIDHFRKCNNSKILKNTIEFQYINLIQDTSLNVEGEIEKKDAITEALTFLEKLPTEQKKIIDLRFYKELSFKEIANQTGVGVNTSLGRMRYALKNLKKLINDNRKKQELILYNSSIIIGK